MTAPVILCEVDIASPAGAASTLRFTDRAIRPLPPGDSLRPNVVWDDRLITPPSLRRALFEDLASLSPGFAFGSMTLSNADRALDAYQGHSWGELRVWRWLDDQPFATALRVMTGLCAQPSFTRSTSRTGQVTVSVYDYRVELDGPFMPITFSGMNGVAGYLYEGTADGLKGKPKPLMFGNVADAHLPAPQVNAGQRVHLLNFGPIGAPQIFDRGAPAGFTYDGDFVGSDFDGHTPPAAGFSSDLGRGMVKINGSPVGTVTFGAVGGPTGRPYAEAAGPIIGHVLDQAGVPAERVGASVAAASSAQVGAWVSEAATARDLVGWLSLALPGSALPDRNGVWQIARLAPPKPAPDYVLTDADVISIEADDTAPAPVGEVSVGWGRIWTTFRAGDLAPSLRGTAAEERLANEYRFAKVEDLSLKARYPRTWRKLQVSTPLRLEADANALADSLKALFGLRTDGRLRRMWKVTVELTPERLAVALGATVRVTSAGVDDLFLLVADEPLRPRRNQMVWTVWG